MLMQSNLPRTTAQGQHFRDTDAVVSGNSDVTNVTDGGFPAVAGYNAQDFLDGVDLSAHVVAAFKAGAIIEFYWMPKNPGQVLNH